MFLRDFSGAVDFVSFIKHQALCKAGRDGLMEHGRAWDDGAWRGDGGEGDEGC